MGLVSSNVFLDYPAYRRDPMISDSDTGDAGDLDATNDKMAFIVQIQKTGTLSLVHFATRAVAVGDDLKISFQNVGADLKPDGVVDEFRVITIGSGDDNQINVTGIVSSDGSDIGTKRSVTEGDWLAVVFEFDSRVAGDIRLGGWLASNNFEPPWRTVDIGSGFTDLIGCVPALGLEYDDGTFGYLKCIPVEDDTVITFDMNDTPDEYSMRFKVPFPCEISGIWWAGGNEWATADFTTDGGTSLVSGPLTLSGSNGSNTNRSGIFFASKIELTADTWYRILYTANHVSSTTSIKTLDVPDAEMLNQFGLNSLNYQFSSRVDGGAWTDVNDRLWIAGIFISKLDDGSGGGGGCDFGALSNGTRVKPLAGA